MSRCATFLLFFIALCVALSQANVVTLTSENFEAEVTKGTWLVKFYAVWCGHCKRLAPVWDSLAVEAEKRDIRVGKVDCNDHEGLCMRFMVAGYPTIKLIRDGKVYDYEGGRTVPEILKFAETDYTHALASTYPSSWVVVAVAHSILDQLAFAFRGFGEDIARHVFLSIAVAVMVAWSCGCVCGRLTAPAWRPNPPLDTVPAAVSATASSSSTTSATAKPANETKKDK